MKATVLFLILVTTSGRVKSWSIKDFMEGTYKLVNATEYEGYYEIMNFLEFNETTIRKAKSGQKLNSGRIIINGLDDTEEMRAVEYVHDNQVADLKNRKIIFRQGMEYRAWTTDGREFYGFTRFFNAQKLKLTVKMSKFVFDCEVEFEFDKMTMRAAYRCIKPMGKPFEVFFNFVRDLENARF